LLERDFNFPPIDELIGEVQQIKNLQRMRGNMKGRTADTASG